MTIPLDTFYKELENKSGLDILELIDTENIPFEKKRFVTDNNLSTGTPGLPNTNASMHLANAYKEIDAAYSSKNR